MTDKRDDIPDSEDSQGQLPPRPSGLSIESIAAAAYKNPIHKDNLFGAADALHKEREKLLSIAAMRPGHTLSNSFIDPSRDFSRILQTSIENIANTHIGMEKQLDSVVSSVLKSLDNQWLTGVTKLNASLLSNLTPDIYSNLQVKILSDSNRTIAAIQDAALRTEAQLAQMTKLYEISRQTYSLPFITNLQTTLDSESRAFEALFSTFAEPVEPQLDNLDLPLWTIENRLWTVESVNLVLPEYEEETPPQSEQMKPAGNVTEFVDDLLGSIDTHFLIALQGARSVLRARGHDYVRHASTSLRELLEHLIRRFAPEPDATNWAKLNNAELDNRGNASRESRFRYICRTIPTNKKFGSFIECDITCYNAVMGALQGGTHGMPSSLTSDDVEVLISKVESLVIFLIRLNERNG